VRRRSGATGPGRFPGDGTLDSQADATPPDILVRLQAIAGLTVVEGSAVVPGYRRFDMELDQPVDHEALDGQRFRQRLVLLHRSEAAPMVLESTGYELAEGSPVQP